jgi:hypothetical protein
MYDIKSLPVDSAWEQDYAAIGRNITAQNIGRVFNGVNLWLCWSRLCRAKTRPFPADWLRLI